jgi:RNA polymerase sigma factor (sigma-70 family)
VLTDAELAIAAANGDRGAFADIYDRYANGLYELCRAVLGDAHEASDAVHDTFVIAATHLAGLRDPARLKPWLCAIARHESIRRSTKRARNRPSIDEVLEVPVADESARRLIAGDAASLVWEAADALTERERAVLVLNVRQGLEGAELAAAAGLPSATTSVLLSRAKTQLATAVRCALLLRSGRDDCAELARVAPRKHAALDGLARKRVARHAATCPVCATTWNKTPEALGALAVAPVVGAPVTLRHHVLNDPQLISFSTPLGGGGWQRDGFPPHEPDESRRRIVGGFAAALIAVLIAAGLWLVSSKDDAPTLAAPRVGHSTTTLGEDFAPWPTDPPHGSTTTSRKQTTTTAKRTTSTTTRRAPGGVTATTSPPAPPATAAPSFSISASAREASVACHGSAHVSANTSGGSPSALYLHWRDPTGSGGSNNMSGSGNSWSGATSSLDSAGTWTWWVSDSLFGGGTRSAQHTIDVTGPC